MWQVDFYTTGSGKSPISDFINKLMPAQKSKVIYCVRLLKEYGPTVREPHSKKLTGYQNLFELRTSGNSPVRLIYYKIGSKYIILHGFVKKTNKIPLNEIQIALGRIH